MNVKVRDLMVEHVIHAEPHHTVEHVRGMMERNRVSSIPVLDPEGAPLGIVSTTDLARDLKNGTPVATIMTEKVYTVPAYDSVHVAARVMRNHGIHHVVVTHEQKVVGILSSFDLLKLVEDHRFTVKTGPTPSTRKGKKRA